MRRYRTRGTRNCRCRFGRGVIKQRVARTGQGRSGGYRLLIAYRLGDRSVFLYGLAKNERENIDEGELATLREILWRDGLRRITRTLKKR